MRSNSKQQARARSEHQLFHVNFHEFIEREQEATSLELADEFGLTLRDVNLLKKKLGRN